MSEPLGAFTYAPVIPALYKCNVCGVHGVRLWRAYQTFADTLECADCACALESKNGKTYSAALDKRNHVCVTTVFDPALQPRLHRMYNGRDVGGDQIGWRVPAVPTEDGASFWGYTSVPAAGCVWWNSMPLHVAK